MTPWKGRAVAAAAAAPGRWPGPRRLWHPRPWESRAAMEQASAPSASEETQASLLEKRAGHRLAACPWQLLAVAELASAGEPASRSAWLARLPCLLLPQPVSVSKRASAPSLWLRFSSRKSLKGGGAVHVLIADMRKRSKRAGNSSDVGPSRTLTTLPSASTPLTPSLAVRGWASRLGCARVDPRTPRPIWRACHSCTARCRWRRNRRLLFLVLLLSD